MVDFWSLSSRCVAPFTTSMVDCAVSAVKFHTEEGQEESVIGTRQGGDERFHRGAITVVGGDGCTGERRGPLDQLEHHRLTCETRGESYKTIAVSHRARARLARTAGHARGKGCTSDFKTGNPWGRSREVQERRVFAGSGPQSKHISRIRSETMVFAATSATTKELSTNR